MTDSEKKIATDPSAEEQTAMASEDSSPVLPLLMSLPAPDESPEPIPVTVLSGFLGPARQLS